MRYIEFLNKVKPIETYITCVHSIKEPLDREKYYRRIVNYTLLIRPYEQYALHGNLYFFKEHEGMQSYKNLFLTYTITSENLKDLYQKMISNKNPRKIYNKIMLLAPLSKCPFCGIGTVSTLDHYLPKSKFPIFSVLPYNLVPSCKDCNTGKGNSYATTKESQNLHPYYDNFTEEQWLFAKILKTSPVSVNFFVNAPSDWNDIDEKRVTAHFRDFDLSKRFSIESSSELAKINSSFKRRTLSISQKKSFLYEEFLDYKSLYKNSWQTALYQALAESDWYCGSGFNG